VSTASAFPRLGHRPVPTTAELLRGPLAVAASMALGEAASSIGWLGDEDEDEVSRVCRVWWVRAGWLCGVLTAGTQVLGATASLADTMTGEAFAAAARRAWTSPASCARPA
jgi:hypothetical protein